MSHSSILKIKKILKVLFFLIHNKKPVFYDFERCGSNEPASPNLGLIFYLKTHHILEFSKMSKFLPLITTTKTEQ